MKPKTIALAILAVLSLASPLLEGALTGSVEPFGRWGLAEAFISLLPVYWWYHLDKQQRGYRAGPLMNVGVIAVTILALPVYFIRSRGWKKGGVAIALAVVFVAATLALEEIGEWVGLRIAG